MSNIDGMLKVINPNKGSHFHLDPNCRGLWQGWTNSVKHGNDVWATDTMTLDEAADQGKFACFVCFKKAGLEVPAHLNHHIVRAEKRAARAAAKAAKLAAKNTTEIVEVPVAPVVDLTESTNEIADDIEARIAAMIAELENMLAALASI